MTVAESVITVLVCDVSPLDLFVKTPLCIKFNCNGDIFFCPNQIKQSTGEPSSHLSYLDCLVSPSLIFFLDFEVLPLLKP